MTRKLTLPKLKPLKRFDYKLVQEKFEGLLINVDRDLQRRTDQAERIRNFSSARCLTLLDVMIRFAINAYHASLYLMAETPEDPARKMGYSLIIAPVNRQLLDLLFSLVFMLDDFPTRSLQYQRAGWRELKEEYQKLRTEYGNAPEWGDYFRAMQRGIEFYGQLFGVTPAEQKHPTRFRIGNILLNLRMKKQRVDPF